jgi:hypothetical protein
MVKIVERMQKAWIKLELLFLSFFNENRLLIKVSMIISDSQFSVNVISPNATSDENWATSSYTF